MTDHFIDEIAPVMKEAKARLVESGFDQDGVVTKILTKQRSRAKAIMDEAENEDIGTIMTGRRGLNKVMEFIMGRVSNKIVQMARFNAVWVVT
jgi:nucleotide-binding universal stress UspA family protein